MLAAVGERTPKEEPLIDKAGNLLDEDCDYGRAGIIFRSCTQKIQNLWNVVSPERQWTPLDQLPDKTDTAGAWAWEGLIAEDPPGLY
jgi:hypothetical protein